MADSNVSVMPGVTEQTVTEAKTGLDNSTPESPIMPENGETQSPGLTDQETAALTLEGEERLEPPAPFDKGGEHVPDPGDVVVSTEKIEELVKGRKASARAAAKAAEKEAAEIAPTPEQKSEKKAAHRGRPPKADKAQKPDKEPKIEKTAHPSKAAVEKKAPAKEEVPSPEPEQPPVPQEAPRSNEPEQIVYLNLSDLYPFKNHPFQVRDDEDMKAMVESVKAGGVNQPAVVRPRADGGYEIVSGHRRQRASELAGFKDMPCIVRNLSDDEAVLKMAEDNINQRKEMLASERSKMLKMQLEAIKHQGARETSGQLDPKEAGKRSNEIVALRNSMTVKQVQRYIRLDTLVPDLMKMVDEKKIAFTPAVELSYIRAKNQRYIAVAIEGQQSAPSLSQAQRMRELDQKNILNGDVIDGIMLEEKKEVDKVIISSQELSQYFGKEKTPREMKDQIIKLLDEWKAKEPELSKPEKKQEQEK